MGLLIPVRVNLGGSLVAVRFHGASSCGHVRGFPAGALDLGSWFKGAVCFVVARPVDNAST